jgi:hypothetical protein
VPPTRRHRQRRRDGGAGRQAARRRGVVGAGRDRDRLATIGADKTVALADGPDALAKAAAEIDSGAVAIRTATAPLSEVEQVWARPDEPGVRTVLVTGS